MLPARRVEAVEVSTRIDAPPAARILLGDGDMVERDFPLSNSDTFEPGAEVRIAVGYGEPAETVFAGVVLAENG